MNTITKKCRHCPDRGRIARPGIQRNKPRNTVPVTLPIHTLEKFHRYTLNPMVMAVRGVDINQHDLVKVDGEILKVASVEVVSEVCVEIRTVRFERYNR